jgi:hypothetical protein
MESQHVQMHFHAVQNDDGVDLSITLGRRTVAVLKLSAASSRIWPRPSMRHSMVMAMARSLNR